MYVLFAPSPFVIDMFTCSPFCDKLINVGSYGFVINVLFSPYAVPLPFCAAARYQYNCPGFKLVMLYENSSPLLYVFSSPDKT